ncbi:MAG: aldehyde dehydrogenase family protein [Candidatus Caenarcaniphilales bacterium]|nr:aldehyde dehydrogenase family protein [Candidatus Caenarcaniphilales bacterium]
MSAVIEGSLLLNKNPSNISEVVSEHKICAPFELDQMVYESQQAFEVWSKTPAPERAKCLARAAQLYADHKEHYSKILHKENGKPLDEARGEIQEVIDTLEFFAGEGRRLYGMVGNSEMPDKSIFTTREPIGPALLITAWNFPAAVPSWKAAPCLIAGNSFILKPSEHAPLSGKIFIDVLNESGLPHGVAQLAVGGADIAKNLLARDEIKIVSFTGSTTVGREIATEAARSFKKCALELGGKNSCIVMDDANLELVQEGLIWGAYGTAGQRCTSTSRLIINKSTFSKISKPFQESISKLYDIANNRPSDKYCPIITAKQLRKVDDLVKEAIAEGAELVCGGKILDDGSHQGYFYEPTILKVKPDMKIAKTEVFGPVLSVIELDEPKPEAFLEQAVAIANDINYGLSNAIYTENVNLGMKSLRRLESGLVYLNAPTIGAECGGASFFGGWKQTGNGSREGGVAALDTYTQYKTISIDYSASLQKAQISNYRND